MSVSYGAAACPLHCRLCYAGTPPGQGTLEAKDCRRCNAQRWEKCSTAWQLKECKAKHIEQYSLSIEREVEPD